MPNFAALRAAVFPLYTKNRRGWWWGGYPPPPSVRGLKLTVAYICDLCDLHMTLRAYDTLMIDSAQSWRIL